MRSRCVPDAETSLVRSLWFVIVVASFAVGGFLETSDGRLAFVATSDGVERFDDFLGFGIVSSLVTDGSFGSLQCLH